MAEILSQSQIDALLKSVESGENVPMEDDANKVKDYDFYSPKKFTKEQLRSIDSIYENMSRLMSSYLSGILRIFSDVTVLQVEEQRYYEYNNALPDAALIGLVEMKPTNINLPDSTIMLDMSNNLSYFLIDRLLGGPGKNSMLSRDFTDIELAIMKGIYEKITGYMLESWKEHLDITGELTSLETNPRLIQVYAPEDIVVIAVLQVKFSDTEGTLSVCIPAMGLESYYGEFTSKYGRAAHKMMTNEWLDGLRKDLIKETISESDLRLKAVFDETCIEVLDLIRLKVNDVIPLPKPLDGVVSVLVDDKPWFKAQLGTSRSCKAIKILDSIDNEESGA